MPSDKEIAETVEKDVQFLQRLGDTMTDARRLLNALVRDYSTMDDMTLNETMTRVHYMVKDLYARVRELADRRGKLAEYKYDIAALVSEPLSNLDPDVHSKLIDRYLNMLSRFQFWLDRMDILLTNVPFNANFTAELIRDMHKEFRASKRDDAEMLAAVRETRVDNADVTVELSAGDETSG